MSYCTGLPLAEHYQLYFIETSSKKLSTISYYLTSAIMTAVCSHFRLHDSTIVTNTTLQDTLHTIVSQNLSKELLFVVDNKRTIGSYFHSLCSDTYTYNSCALRPFKKHNGCFPIFRSKHPEIWTHCVI